MNIFQKLFIFLILGIQCNVYAQDTVNFFTSNGEYKYFIGHTEPDLNWKKPDFNDSQWITGFKNIGYGDGDDSTVIDTTSSVYLRIKFDISDISKLKDANLIVDFDDGFVAYLNGKEIVRVNLGSVGELIPHNRLTDRSHEAYYYRHYFYPENGYYIDSTTLFNCIKNGINVLAIQVHNDSLKGSDMSFNCRLVNLNNKKYDFYHNECRYIKQVKLDSTNFPIVIINTDEYGIPGAFENKYTAHMVTISNKKGINKPTDPPTNYNGRISIEIRGKSSRDFPKKSYNIETQDILGRGVNVSLLDMPDENDWVLFGPFADKSQIRNEFVFTLGRQLGYYEPRTRFCELIMNGEYYGLYILTERIKVDKNRVNVTEMSRYSNSGIELTGGYLIEIGMGTNIIYPNDATSAQKKYITDLLKSYSSNVRKYADDNSLIDYILIHEIIKNCDAYVLSVYLYKDRDDIDGHLKFGPFWDYDYAIGNATFQEGEKTDGWQFEFNKSSSLNILKHMKYTSFANKLVDRWVALRQSIFHKDSVNHLIDSLVTYIHDAQIRNYTVWPIIDKKVSVSASKIFAFNYDEDIQFIKDWLNTRIDWMDANITKFYKPTNITFPSYTANNKDKCYIYPNPFSDNLNLLLNLDTPGIIKIEIYDLTGRKYKELSQKFFGSGLFETSIDLPTDMDQGIYTLNIYKDNYKILSQKVIKMR